MTWPRLRWLALALLVIISPQLAGAASVLSSVDASGEVTNLATHTTLLRDAHGELGIGDVSAPSARARFSALAPERLNIGFSDAAYWLRVSVTARGPLLRYLEAYQGTDDARLFIADAHGTFREQRLGRRLPFRTRPVPHKSLYFPIELPRGETTLYLRLHSADTQQFGLRLLSAEALAKSVGSSRLVAGLYLGSILALTLYNLLIFAWLRDRAYLYYVIFQLAIAALQATLDQLTFQFLWPDSPLWSADSETVFVGIALFSAAGFVRHFLGTAQQPAPAGRVLSCVQVFGLALALVCPLTVSPLFAAVAIAFVGGACATLLGVGVISWWRGGTNAPFFVVAWGTLLAGTVLTSLTALGVLPTVAIGQESTRVGSTVEAVLLSLGLAHRINRMRREERRRLVEANDTIENALTATELIGSGSERIRQIVDDLRSFLHARPAALEPTNVADVIQRTVKLMQPKLRASATQVELELEPLPDVALRGGELGQLIMNLLLNSCQAMKHGGHITVSARRTGNFVEIRVADDGPGVPHEIRDSIFDPFFTTRPPNEGIGLGLSICHQIAVRHGGELRLDPSTRGAAFVLCLPLFRAERGDTGETSAGEQPAAAPR